MTADQTSSRARSQSAVLAVATIPRDEHGPTFNEPWQAQAFAIVVSLQENGLLSWDEWALALGDEITRGQAAGDQDTDETYYSHWLNALERLVEQKFLVEPQALMQYRDAWGAAADRTPHGVPIELEASDFAR